MDLVAITDHDSIDGALELLDARPDATDVIVGEEVSCRLPDGDIEVHLGVYGMTEALHREMQPLRRNVFDVTARLREADVFFSLNHLLHFYRGQIPFDRYLRLLDEVPALEVRNGTMLPAHNALVESIAERRTAAAPMSRLAMVAGSDAHTLRRVGRTWTTAPGRTREEFLASLRQGLGRPGGAARRRGDRRRRRLRRDRPVSRLAGRFRPARSPGLAPRGLPGVRRRVAAVPVHAAGDRDGAARRASGARSRGATAHLAAAGRIAGAACPASESRA